MKGSEGVMDSMDERDRQMLLEVKEQTARILERLDHLSSQREEDRENIERIMDLEHSKQNLRMEQIENRISKIESNNTWLWRTIAGIIITAVLGVVITL